MAKVVYNSCFGGFSLSHLANTELRARKGAVEFDVRALARHDPDLVAVVEMLGERANGDYAKLAICEIPDGARYRIDEYDGAESVMMPDDYQWIVAK
jgi:hypothetical protein